MKEKLRIVKIGGNVINDRKQLQSFLKDFSDMESLKILVHGGGKRATELAASLGLKTQMIGGRRVTDEANLEIVTMVYAGLLNKNIVAKLQANNCNAIGLTGADANTIMAHKRIVKDIDYGYAGDVDSIENESIKLFLNNGIVPIFSAITCDCKHAHRAVGMELIYWQHRIFSLHLRYSQRIHPNSPLSLTRP